MAPRDWSAEENEATVRGYFDLFERWCRDEGFSKVAEYRRLEGQLDRRTEKAIEYKFQNVSGVLYDEDRPFLSGLAPQRNYQASLADAVRAHLASHPYFDELLKSKLASAPQPSSRRSDKGLQLVDVPPLRSNEEERVRAEWSPRIREVDWAELDARNRAVGERGERLVLDSEQHRLRSARRDDLAERVDWVAKDGSGHGFDIRSFEIAGTDRLIEVKTTKLSAYQPFVVTRNEVECSSRRAEDYHLYRVFDLESAPSCFVLSGSLATSLRLTPQVWRARLPLRA